MCISGNPKTQGRCCPLRSGCGRTAGRTPQRHCASALPIEFRLPESNTQPCPLWAAAFPSTSVSKLALTAGDRVVIENNTNKNLIFYMSIKQEFR
jgi:hypothetical protein